MEETDSAKQYARMTQTALPKLIASLAVPTVISSVITSVYNLTDTYFVSQISNGASAAVGIVFSLQSLIQAFGYGVGMGAGSLVSRKLGEKDSKSASVYASSAFVAAFLFGALVAAVCLPMLGGVMTLFGANEEILPHACDYGRYILMAAPLMCSTFVLNIVIRSCGKSTLSMIGIASGAVLNVILDPLFISDRFLGLGTAGAAIATVIGQAVSFIVFAVMYLTGHSLAEIRIKNVSLSLRTYADIIRTGAPTIFRQGMACISSTFLNNFTRPFGTAAIAAMTVANKIYQLMRGMLLGIGQGYQPVAGYNYGAKRYDRVRKGFWVTVLYGTVLAIGFTVVTALNAPAIMALFRAEDADVIAYGSRALYDLCFVLPLLAYSSYVNMTLQCLGRVKSASFLALCRNGVFYMPLLFILPRFLGFAGIRLTQPGADLLTFCVSVPFCVIFFRKLKKRSLSDENSAENGSAS